MDKKLVLLFSIIAFVACCVEGLGWWDFKGQWAINVYLLHGVDPYLRYTAEEIKSLNLPIIPEGWGTSPWGMVLGQVFYAGWLPLATAKIYFLLLHIVAYLGVVLYCVKKFPKQKIHILLLVLSALCWYIRPINSGNAGALLALLLLFSIICYKKHVIVAALCLALAMIKPQLALLFCIFFLIKKQFLLLTIAATVDVIAWGITCVVLNVDPLTILKEFLGCNIGEPGSYYGIATLFVDKNLVMPISMSVGVVFSLIGYYIHKSDDELLQIIPFSVATSFWAYSWGNEMLILIPFAIWFYERFVRTTWHVKWFYLSSFLYLVMGRLIITAVKHALIPIVENKALALAITLYMVGLIVLMPWKRVYAFEE